VGPSQLVAGRRSNQEAGRPRNRRCLIKGCDRSFQPHYPFTRYCGSACFAAAQRWSEQTNPSCAKCARRASQQKANRKYRASEKGKACRREQTRRYRQRCREHQEQLADSAAFPPEWEGEGYIPHRRLSGCPKIFCRRPGCYVRFQPPPRSPLTKFCSAACRQAYRRVAVREQRWRERLGNPVRRRGDRDEFW
jgi:hypothetical protein